MDSALKIITLKKVAFLLFIIPFFALVLSILSANLFYSFDYHYYPNFYKADKIEFECNKSNNYCLDLYLSKSNKIDGCSKYYIGYHYQINDEIIAEDEMCFIIGKSFNDSSTHTLSRMVANKIYKLEYTHCFATYLERY